MRSNRPDPEKRPRSCVVRRARDEGENRIAAASVLIPTPANIRTLAGVSFRPMTSTTAIRRTVLAAAFVCAFVPVFLTAQAPKPIALDDYARFKRIGGAAISSDGKWMVYTVTPNDGDGTLFVQSLDTATKHEVPRGTGAVVLGQRAARGVLRGAGVVARTRRGRAWRCAAAAAPATGATRPQRRRPHARSSCSTSPTAPRRAAVRREFLVLAGRRLAADSPAGRGHDAGAGR